MEAGNPYVFVVGCPRSGTTLLQRMLDNHPQLAVANDTHFIPAAIQGLTPRADLPLTREMTERVRRFRTPGGMGFYRLGLPDGSLEAAAERATTYPELVAALYTRLAELRGKRWAGEKTPDYVRCLPLLRALFPRARLIHLIRDARDVTLALIDWVADPQRGRARGPARSKLWHTNPVAACALWWRWQVDSGRRDAADVGPGYRELRYETLVARPHETLRELARFLEIPFSAQMLEYDAPREKRPDDPATGASAWLPPTAGLRDWRTQMAPRDVELVEALVGDLLEELGYERAFAKVSPETRARAKQYRKHWARKVARRAARLTPSVPSWQDPASLQPRAGFDHS